MSHISVFIDNMWHKGVLSSLQVLPFFCAPLNTGTDRPGMIDDWKALNLWTGEYLANKIGDLETTVDVTPEVCFH